MKPHFYLPLIALLLGASISFARGGTQETVTTLICKTARKTTIEIEGIGPFRQGTYTKKTLEVSSKIKDLKLLSPELISLQWDSARKVAYASGSVFINDVAHNVSLSAPFMLNKKTDVYQSTDKAMLTLSPLEGNQRSANVAVDCTLTNRMATEVQF